MNGLPPGNRLINALGAGDREALLQHCTRSEFSQGFVFFEPGDEIEQIHFIDSGIASSVAVLEDGRTVETVMIGPEGLTGSAAAAVPHRAFTDRTSVV